MLLLLSPIGQETASMLAHYGFLAAFVQLALTLGVVFLVTRGRTASGLVPSEAVRRFLSALSSSLGQQIGKGLECGTFESERHQGVLCCMHEDGSRHSWK